MAEWNIGPFEFVYWPIKGELQMFYSSHHIATDKVPMANTQAAKVAAATMLLKHLNEWKFRLFEYLKDIVQ